MTKTTAALILATIATQVSETPVRSQEPVINLKGREIVHFGVVVKDVEKSAERFSEIFGVPSWVYLDLSADKFRDVILHDEYIGEAAQTHLRIATADVMGYQFELIQPVSGQGTHMEFLEKHGEGIHHISISPLPPDDHANVVASLKAAGVEVEMQGLLGGATTFTYMDLVDELGLLFEIYKTDPDAVSTIEPSGRYEFAGASVLGNKIIAQIGIVVEDVRKSARQYEELLGIGPWEFIDVPIANGVLHDQPIGQDDVIVKIALATHEGLRFELVQPVRGPSTHREFLEEHGNGIHHLAFVNRDGSQTHDVDQQLLQEQGIGVEMQGIIFDGTGMFTYLASQEQLAGIIFEMGKRLGQ